MLSAPGGQLEPSGYMGVAGQNLQVDEHGLAEPVRATNLLCVGPGTGGDHLRKCLLALRAGGL